MIYNPVERRRAEEFARQLESDGPIPPHSSDIAHASGASAESLAELIGVTGRLNDLGEQMAAVGRPSTDWQEATRRRLMAVAADEGIGVTARHRASAAVPESAKEPVRGELFPRRPRGGRRLAIVAALLTGTVAISGVSAASGDALPGETLYNVKRSTELAQLALAGNDLGRAQLHLEFAGNRIDEAVALGDDENVANALSEAAGELRSGAALLGELAVEHDDTVPLDYIDRFANEYRWTLEGLVTGLNGEAETAGEELLALVEAAALRSVELRGALDCTVSEGPSDGLGPIPGECTDVPDLPESAEPSDRGGTETANDVDGFEGTGSGSTPDETEPSHESASPEAADETTAPPTDAASDPATEGTVDESEPEGTGGVLVELSDIVKDLFG